MPENCWNEKSRKSIVRGFHPVGFKNPLNFVETPPCLLFLCSLNLISFSFTIVMYCASAADTFPCLDSHLYSLQTKRFNVATRAFLYSRFEEKRFLTTPRLSSLLPVVLLKPATRATQERTFVPKRSALPHIRYSARLPLSSECMHPSNTKEPCRMRRESVQKISWILWVPVLQLRWCRRSLAR